MNEAAGAIRFYELGNAEMAKGNYEKAEDLFRQAIELYPDDAAFFIGRALASAYSGNISQALLDISEALKLSPNNPYIYVDCAKIYMRFGDPKKALESLELALEMPPDPRQYFPDGFFVSESSARRILEKAKREKDEIVLRYIIKIRQELKSLKK